MIRVMKVFNRSDDVFKKVTIVFIQLDFRLNLTNGVGVRPELHTSPESFRQVVF